MTTIELAPAPVTSDAPPCWPPVAHIIRAKDRPVREGTIALCGARLMGIDLDGTPVENVCAKCKEKLRSMVRC